MKSILFPTDFSENAAHAAHFAVMLAKKIKAKIILLNIYGIPVITSDQLAYDATTLIEDEKHVAWEQFNEFKEKFIKETGFEGENIEACVKYGFPSEGILSTAADYKADFIVMGTKGASNIIDQFLGTNSYRVAHHSDCPVLIVPEKASLKPWENMLYAADFESDEIAGTHSVVDFSRLFKSKITVLHIREEYEPAIVDPADVIEWMREEFEGENVTFKNLNRSNVIQGLETYLKTHPTDLLILANQERGFFEELFHKSVTKHFIQASNLPILIVRKKQQIFMD
ncbi:Nucleotide-binding universal stress protein, UspA family [Pseudarcicella hirudinis]|uniref:Nucleotide-binding universal stress protein, UspA family n=1 Tax=Pseudarcicella hirudinis TaxID=1079859 RepID=A0A1I5NVG6_9BACT|nr:universal stress protein [Pseudarcicella hirudinis]SFP25763.1 Nucleotide-binding universal stress protein, UspA family [Pseudarcicella hirudinis]